MKMRCPLCGSEVDLTAGLCWDGCGMPISADALNEYFHELQADEEAKALAQRQAEEAEA